MEVKSVAQKRHKNIAILIVVLLLSAAAYGLLAYLSGSALPPANTPRSMESYQAAAEGGDVYSMAWMGDFFRKKTNPPDYSKSTFWYQKAFDGGMKEAGYLLGLAYKSGEGVAQDYQKAADYFEASAESSPRAQYELAMLYKHGRGVALDEVKSLELLKLSAGRGDGFAHLMLGDRLLKDNQTSEAIDHIKKAAEQRVPTAAYFLAQTYIEGRITPKDYIVGGKYLLQASEEGSIEAAQFLQRKVQQCKADSDIDEEQAQSCLIASAVDDPDISLAVGAFFDAGQFVEKDTKKSFEYFLKSAERGKLSAQMLVANAYLDGTDVDEDKVRAYAWASIAKQNSEEFSDERAHAVIVGLLESLDKNMSEEEIEAAKELSSTLVRN